MFLKNLSVTNQKKNKMNILLLINIGLFAKKHNNELFIFNKTKKGNETLLFFDGICIWNEIFWIICCSDEFNYNYNYSIK